MGLVLDTSPLVLVERAGQTLSDLLRLGHFSASTVICCSVVTLMELAHGAERADSPARRTAREQFLQDLRDSVHVIPVTDAIAIRAGKLDAQLRTIGVQVPLADLLIGATALEQNYSVVTANLRHFQQIPGLIVHPYPA
jgi:tRNA(fMet)-specific endonuclease VapC